MVWVYIVRLLLLLLLLLLVLLVVGVAHREAGVVATEVSLGSGKGRESVRRSGADGPPPVILPHGPKMSI